MNERDVANGIAKTMSFLEGNAGFFDKNDPVFLLIASIILNESPHKGEKEFNDKIFQGLNKMMMSLVESLEKSVNLDFRYIPGFSKLLDSLGQDLLKLYKYVDETKSGNTLKERLDLLIEILEAYDKGIQGSSKPANRKKNPLVGQAFVAGNNIYNRRDAAVTQYA
jgi:hypothetical protein